MLFLSMLSGSRCVDMQFFLDILQDGSVLNHHKRIIPKGDPHCINPLAPAAAFHWTAIFDSPVIAVVEKPKIYVCRLRKFLVFS